jgi:hypothetical protein
MMPVFGGVPCRIMMTRGITALPPLLQISIAAEVRNFNDFTEDNDPHGEHDFGAFDIEGAGKIFWKIDYYDSDLQYGSEDPADPQKTTRVLTIMLASEY